MGQLKVVQPPNANGGQNKVSNLLSFNSVLGGQNLNNLGQQNYMASAVAPMTQFQ